MQLARATLVPFRADFGTYEDEIKSLSKNVEKEADLASKQDQRMEMELQARERAANGGSRRVTSMLRDSYNRTDEENKAWRLEILQRRSEKRKLEFLDLLSTYEYQKTYRRVRKECVPGTCRWICQDPKYRD